MNDQQRGYLIAILKHVDELLGEARHILLATDAPSVFTWYDADASAVQRQVARAYIDDIGNALVRTLEDLGLTRPAAVCGSLWAVRTQITFAQVSLADMTPSRLAGYGSLSKADGCAVERAAAELRAALARLADYLAQGSDADLAARLKLLEQTRDEVPLLRELERIITAHGLIALRGTLSMLLNRLETERFEIGVFGRVNSGKSSLMNHLIGAMVLPVGVTPVTAVPTRIQFGKIARATVEFARQPPQTFELASLPEFVSEQGNPDNRKQVMRIVVELDAPRLREGVTWVDTPGLGALSTHGATETSAYLPRCDLGLVLIDAGGSLTQDDLVLVQALLRSGADAMVLVSKADLLGAAERAQFVDYVQAHLAAQFGQSLPVHLVSVVGTDAALCDSWFEQVLQPRLVAHRRQAAEALKRKVGLLRDVVIGTLETRSAAAKTEDRGQFEANLKTASDALHGGEGLIAAARRQAETILDTLTAQTEPLLDASAAAIVDRWSSTSALDGRTVSQVCGEVFQRMLLASGAELRGVLTTLAEKLEDALRLGHRSLGGGDDAVEALPRPTGQPTFDIAVVTRGLDLQAPMLRALLPVAWQRAWVGRKLRAQWAPTLPDFLRDGSRTLRAWMQSTLAELQQGFRTTAASLILQTEARIHSPQGIDGETAAADLRRLRELDVKNA